jgi:hypothetical protein
MTALLVIAHTIISFAPSSVYITIDILVHRYLTTMMVNVPIVSMYCSAIAYQAISVAS